MRFFTFTIIALLLPMVAFSQKTEIGVALGITNYQGDLVEPSFSLKESNLIYGGLLKHHFSPKLALRAALNFGKITGDDANFDELSNRGFSFESNIFEFGAGIEFTPFGRQRYDDGGTFQKTISPFVYIGLGFISTNPDIDDTIKRTSEEIDAGSLLLSIPLGIGFKADLSERWTFAVDLSSRATGSDYLDGFADSANPDKNDWYFIGALTMTYRLGASATNSVGE